MDLDHARDFARRTHRAVMATRTRDGGVQQTPVLVGVDDEGCFTVSTRETAYKTKHLRRDPWTQLCVLNDRFFGDWLYVTGKAEIVSLPDAMPLLEDYYRNVAGAHDDWEEYRSAMRLERRVLIRVHATHAGPDLAG
jgi:PPOX class probable F420-dependent enzyme